MIHYDGDTYEGDWVNNMAQGYGVYHKANGWVYEGQWLQDKPHGEGKETWPDRASLLAQPYSK